MAGLLNELGHAAQNTRLTRETYEEFKNTKVPKWDNALEAANEDFIAPIIAKFGWPKQESHSKGVFVPARSPTSRRVDKKDLENAIERLKELENQKSHEGN